MNEIDLLQKQVDMMRIAEKYGVKDWRELVRYQDSTHGLSSPHYNFLCRNIDYKFALAVVEGKPVFDGDELWNAPNSFKFAVKGIKINYLDNEDFLYGTGDGGYLSDMSWNPPKPKTVLVELPLEDVEFWTSYNHELLPATSKYNNASNNFYTACKKALEKQ